MLFVKFMLQVWLMYNALQINEKMLNVKASYFINIKDMSYHGDWRIFFLKLELKQ